MKPVAFHSYEDNSGDDEVLIIMHFTDFVKRFCKAEEISSLDSWKHGYFIRNYGSEINLLRGEFREWVDSLPALLSSRIQQAMINTIHKQNREVEEVQKGKDMIILPGSSTTKTGRIYDVVEKSKIQWYMSKANATYFRLKFVD